jgi:anti-sigma factor RsiW
LDEEALEGGGFPLNHTTQQEWEEYVSGTLSPSQNQQLEQHLYDCEDCLQQYILAIDSIDPANDTLTALSVAESATFANRILSAIQEASIADARSYEAILEAPIAKQGTTLKLQRIRRIPLIRSPLFQYTVAAAATLLLLMTGVFQSIGTIAAKDNSSGQPVTQFERHDESFSQRLLERTTSLLDNIHPNHTGGTPRE